MKRILLFFIISALLLFYSLPKSNAIGDENDKKFGVKKVVIDAGHGGHDSGCSEGKWKEKDIALSIALKFGRCIEDHYSDVKVIYTRSTDEFIELHRRAEIANENKADLFISIHCNANPSSKPYGTETYVMGVNKTAANLEVAKKENSSILFEDNYSAKYDGFDPNSTEANIIFSLYQNAYLDKSLNFASKVEKQFKEKVGRYDRGVKQAGFLVIYKTYMPSVLIETGFLSNRAEGRFLASDKGQEYLASAIFRAFKEYKAEVEGTKVPYDYVDKVLEEAKKTIKVRNDSLNPELDMGPREKQESKEDKKIDKKDNVKKDSLSVKKSSNIKEDKVLNVDKNVDIKKGEEKKSEDKKSVNENNGDKKESAIKKNYSIKQQNKIIFSVQILASIKKIPDGSKEFKDIKDINEYIEDGRYLYGVGKYKTFDAARASLKELRHKGFKEAYIIAFNNSKKISVDDAKNLTKKQK